MLRRLALVITTITLVFLPLIFAPKILAADWKIGDPINTFDQLTSAMNGSGGLDKNLQDFCAKRQGNQMNLETWYSGKCTDDTFGGEGVGFSDIVILDLAEKLTGKKDPSNTFMQTLRGIIDALKTEPTSYANPKEQQIALDSARQKLFYGQDTGIVGQVGRLISTLFQSQPASTGSYLAYVTQNLQRHKVIPPALAATPQGQGVGFATLSPFLTIWIVFRNLAYLGLVIFFIIYGFMMMFRVNLGQKTVITVQLAIPKLIITLLIITFSYAIVGLIYDLMWVVIAFIFGYLESQNIIVTGSTLWNLGRVAGGYTWASFMGSFILNSLIAGPAAIFGVLNLILGGVIATIGTIVSFIPLFGSGGGWLISLIIIIAVLISYAKLFFKLVTAFISVIISLITAPLVLLGNAFPGSKVIGTWIRGIVANLSVFPITMLLLFFSYLLMIQPILGICVGSPVDEVIKFFGGVYNSCEYIFGVKSLIAAGNSGIYNIPLISTGLGTNAQGLLALLGVGLLLMASKYVDIVRDALKVPSFKYGSDIAEALKLGIKYAPATPGVGAKVGESTAYQNLAKLAKVTPDNLSGTLSPAGPEKPSGQIKSPINAGTSDTTDSQAGFE